MKVLGDPRSERGLYGLIAAAALVVIYLVAFIVSNATEVKVSFVLFSGAASLILVMVFCILLGVVLGVVVGRLFERNRTRRSTSSTSSSTRSEGTA